MADTPEAAAPATEATPTQTNNEPSQVPEQAPASEINAEQVAKYLGTNAETLGKFQKFVEANGQFDTAFSKMKTGISNPEKPAESSQEPKQDKLVEAQPAPQPIQRPKGAVTRDAIIEKYYFDGLADNPEFAPIAKEIKDGSTLEEMDKLGIPYRYQDGSLDDDRIKQYLSLKAKTVPATPTSTEPNASTAPTVDYVAVGDKIESLEQAQAVFMQAGHPKRELAKEFIKNYLNPNSSQEKK